MTPLKILIFGSGKLAQSLQKLIASDPTYKKIQILATLSKSDTDHLLDGATSIDPSQVDLVLDIASAPGLVDRLSWCCEQKVPALIGTTGWLEQKELITTLVEGKIHVLYQANFAKGYNAYKDALKLLYKKIAPAEQVHLEEMHCITKKDLPSGSAIEIQNLLETIHPIDPSLKLSSLRYDRAGNCSSEKELVARHRVTFSLEGEEIELTHRTFSRTPYAQGALHCALTFYKLIQETSFEKKLHLSLPQTLAS